MSSGKPETRIAILEAARRLFERRGAPAVRLADIAREAGVSRQGLYLHFSSRTELLVALVQYVDREEGLAQRAAGVWDAPDGTTALERFVALHATYTPRIYPVAKTLLSGRYLDEAVAAAWEDRMRGRRQACQRILRWLQADGVLAPGWEVDDATDVLWALTSIQVWEQLVSDRGWSQHRYERHLGVVVRRTFLQASDPLQPPP